MSPIRPNHPLPSRSALFTSGRRPAARNQAFRTRREAQRSKATPWTGHGGTFPRATLGCNTRSGSLKSCGFKGRVHGHVYGHVGF